MTQDYNNFDYPAMVDNAMRGVVKEVLQQADRDGFSGEHHFYISFNTNYPGVSLSSQLKAKYPDEMTIVLQHQFWDMDIQNERFSLMLSFNNVPEKLVIPYDAMTAFADPSVKFGLQFHEKEADDADTEDDVEIEAITETTQTSIEKDEDGNNVISIDAFRKK